MLNLNGISIRPAADSELPLIKELARRIWPETYGKILTPAQIDYMIEMMYALPVLQRERGEGISFDLICDGDRPVGFLSYGPYRKEPLTMKLHKLYLDFSYHGRGIGSNALQYAIDVARKQGYRFLRLNVNKENENALRAYRRNGFQQVEAVKIDIGGGFFMDDFVMEIAL
ncbi:GNAT family N-acetyltransferase [uncultured Victivallis sp.]|uniref:GNAT family N-acetyltransferase n=1 Tax=uncultured Victivallis sp. TaxID=354118 RepID=UPI0025D1CA96|nr:GNAT family N-acetyltransferase [uncultured Victivallis sp.]